VRQLGKRLTPETPWGLLVMAGLVPLIHVYLFFKDVDARHKGGHDK
jgi:hypothetical protein